MDTVPWSPLPKQLAAAVYPNPWYRGLTHPSLVVKLPERRYLRIRLVDALGREVALLAQGLYQPGTHTIVLEPAVMSSGIYFLYIVVEREGIVVPLVIAH
ncbi:MAG: T9SS type A sorting domain-containing protein [Bacteroidota bacterium]|nr:T9SS type A sorting domain-containing protein [Bacteroidota bacterium]